MTVADKQVKKIRKLFRSFVGSNNFKGQMISQNLMANLLNPELQQVMIHESHHYWQSLFYPFLFYINFLEYHGIVHLRREVRLSKEAQVPFDHFGLNTQTVNNFHFCCVNFRYYWNDNNTLEIDVDYQQWTDWYDADIFCLNDLIEDSTTIFEFKASNEDAGPERYFEWIQNPANRAYKKLYKFLCKRFDPKYAYHFIPILTQLAFHTTEPISIFRDLVNMTIAYNLEKSFDEIDYFLLKDMIKIRYKTVDLNPADTYFIQDIPVGFIDDALYGKIITYANMNTGSAHYPLSVHARKYLNWKNENEHREMALIEIDHQRSKELLETFFPYAIHVNFLDLHARDTAIVCSSPDYQEYKIKDQTVDYGTMVKEMVKMKEVTLALFSNAMDDTPFLCHHKQCAYYNIGICRKWNSVPADYKECKFPAWFAWNYLYEISVEDNCLKKINAKQEKAYEKEFFRINKKFAEDRFRYVGLDQYHIVLLINKEVLNNNDHSYVEEFLNKISNTRDPKRLFSFLVIEFPDHKDDPRPVFQIPEIKKYVQVIMDRVPALFYYLALKGKFQTHHYMFPFFVKHKATVYPDTSFMVQYDHHSLEAFIKRQMSDILDHCLSQKLDPNFYLEEFVKHSLQNSHQ
jgi:hypothetical protein